MGEYAEACMWAEMNGYEDGDMPIEAWMAFYREYDARRPIRNSPGKPRCPICGKMKSGLRQHIEAVHRNAKGHAALAAMAAN